MKVCVFCSSKAHLMDSLADVSSSFAQTLVADKMELVYGGSTDGLMGQLADSVLQMGGRVTGVFPEGLFPTEVAHRGLSKMFFTKDLMARKTTMMDISDAFVMFPGGIGTLDEALEVMTWKSLGKLDKPIFFFNWNGFWDSFLTLMSDLESKNVLYPEAMTSFSVVNNLDALFKGLNDARK